MMGLKQRHRTSRVDGAEVVGVLLAFAQIDLNDVEIDALLGGEDAHPAGIRRGGEVVKLHGGWFL